MILTIYSSADKQGKIVHLVNDKTIKADETGMIIIDTNEFAITENRNIHAYDVELDKIINTKQKQELYNLLIDSTRFGIRDLMILLEVEKSKIQEILNIGFKNHVLGRIDTQWRLKKDQKEFVVQLIKKYEREQIKEDTEIMMPFKHTMTHEQCQTKTMADMGIGPVEIKKKKK